MQGPLYTYNALIIVLFTCNKNLHVFKTDFILQFEVYMLGKLHNYHVRADSMCNHIIEVITYTVGSKPVPASSLLPLQKM
jgi:hypothetical protein